MAGGAALQRQLRQLPPDVIDSDDRGIRVLRLASHHSDADVANLRNTGDDTSADKARRQRA